MEKITTHTGIGVPLRQSNVDTDQIIPARFLKCITFDELAGTMFYDERFNADGSSKGHPIDAPQNIRKNILADISGHHGDVMGAPAAGHLTAHIGAAAPHPVGEAFVFQHRHGLPHGLTAIARGLCQFIFAGQPLTGLVGAILDALSEPARQFLILMSAQRSPPLFLFRLYTT